jgi:hypothetical protein
MQDIRAGLKERLDSIAKERAMLRTRLAEAEIMESTIRALLQQEEGKFGKLEPTLPFNGNAKPIADPTVRGGTPLSQLIIGTIQQANRPRNLDQFKEAAERLHFDFGDKKPGRVLHWALVALEQSNVLERTKDGYKLREEISKDEPAKVNGPLREKQPASFN